MRELIQLTEGIFNCSCTVDSARQIHRTVGLAGQICGWSDLPHFSQTEMSDVASNTVYSESDRYKFGPMK